jgi:hypothetical protein
MRRLADVLWSPGGRWIKIKGLVRLWMKGVSLVALAARDTPRQWSYVITETLV